MELNTVQLMSIEYASLALILFLGFKCMYLRKGNMDYFWRYVVSTFLMALVNIPVRLAELGLVTWNRDLVFCLYAASVVTMTLSCAYWCVFLLKQTDSSLVSSPLKTALIMLPAFCVIVLCIVNYRTGWMYVIDDLSRYHRGPVFVLQGLVSYCYIGLFTVCYLICLAKGHSVSIIRKCHISIPPVIAGIILQILYGGSCLVFCTVLCGWIMYIEICLDRQKAYEISEEIRNISSQLTDSNKALANNMRTVLALSNMYDVLFEIDVANNSYNEIKAPWFISGFCREFTDARSFMAALAPAAYAEEYVDTISSLFDLDAIDDTFRTRDISSVDAIAGHSGEWIRTTLIVTERNADKKVSRLVLTFQDITNIVEQQKMAENAKKHELDAQDMKEVFIQTADALTSAIDAKDRYTHGHSGRVAEYSRRIAEIYGLPEAECERIYFAALLHDVGKIGIPDSIIEKAGRLTEEEYRLVKQHTLLGDSILGKITARPYLRTGAKYHHERYDGKGYPEGLAGRDIPEMARIIAVADSYDAMTSCRTYCSPMAQQKVREDLVKGIGTQFDPDFATIMIHILDKDSEYRLRGDENQELFREDYVFDVFGSQCTPGILVSDSVTTISFNCDASETGKTVLPSVIVFDSLDGLVYTDGDSIDKMEYTGFFNISSDGGIVPGNIRDFRINEYADPDRVSSVDMKMPAETQRDESGDRKVRMETVRHRDHLLIKVFTGGAVREYTIALWDRSQYAYAALTGDGCRISSFRIEKSDTPVGSDYIERIAGEISYISDRVEGDLKNIEIAGWREKYSESILIESDLDLSFHFISLPAARRLWHCPFIVLYSSDDGSVGGPGYRELSLIRLNGEYWDEDEKTSNDMKVTFSDDFINWDEWKALNKKGSYCTVHIERYSSKILYMSESGGVHIENTTSLPPDISKVYLALTGDQTAITGIRIMGSSRNMSAPVLMR